MGKSVLVAVLGAVFVFALPAVASAAVDLRVTVIDKNTGQPVDRNEVQNWYSDDENGWEAERIVRITNVGTTPIERPAYRIFGNPEEPGYVDCLASCYQVNTNIEWAYYNGTLTQGQYFEVEVGFFRSGYPDAGEELSGQIGLEVTQRAVWNDAIVDYELAPVDDANPSDNAWTNNYTQAWRYAYVALPPRPWVGAKPVPANTPFTHETYVYNEGPDTFEVPFMMGIWGSGDVSVLSVEVGGDEPDCEPGISAGDVPGLRCLITKPIPGGSQLPIVVTLKTAGGWGNLGITVALGWWPDPEDPWFESSRDERYLRVGAQLGDVNADDLERAYGFCSKSVDPDCGDGLVEGPEEPWIRNRSLKLSGKSLKFAIECFSSMNCRSGKLTATGTAKFKKGKKVKKVKFMFKMGKADMGVITVKK